VNGDLIAAFGMNVRRAAPPNPETDVMWMNEPHETTARHEKIPSPRLVESWFRTGRPEVAISDIDRPSNLDIRCLIPFMIKSPSSRHPILAESDFYGH
jgi:hypothetical protein